MPRWFVTGAGGQLATRLRTRPRGRGLPQPRGDPRHPRRRGGPRRRPRVRARRACSTAPRTPTWTGPRPTRTSPRPSTWWARATWCAPCAARTRPSCTSAPTTSSTAPRARRTWRATGPNPLNVYGRTKLGGEQEVLGWVRGIVIRTVVAVQRDRPQLRQDDPGARRASAPATGEPLRVVDDQVGSPTYAGHLAAAVDEAVRAGPGPGPLPHGRERLLLVVRAGPGGRAARRPRGRGRADHHRRGGPPGGAAAVLGARLASGPSRACRTGRTAWPRPWTGSSRSADGHTQGGPSVRLVVTGGAGFIGSNFIRYMLAEHEDVEIVNLDKLTYAGNLENLRDVEDDPRYTLRARATSATPPSSARRCAAPTPWSTSPPRPTSTAPSAAPRTSSAPTCSARTRCSRRSAASRSRATCRSAPTRSTGASRTGAFTEESDLDPSSPYSASKAGADLLVLAYHRTFGTPVLITRSSNNYGAVPVPGEDRPAVHHQRDRRPAAAGVRRRPQRARLAVRGRQLRRHRPGAARGRAGAGLQHRRRQRGAEPRHHAPDPRAARQGRRSSSATSPTAPATTAATPSTAPSSRRSAGSRGVPFETGLARTVEWYASHPEWWRPIKSGEWREYYERQYGGQV